MKRQTLSPAGNLTHFEADGNSQISLKDTKSNIMETSTLILEQILMPQKKVHYWTVTQVTMALSDIQGDTI